MIVHFHSRCRRVRVHLQPSGFDAGLEVPCLQLAGAPPDIHTPDAMQAIQALPSLVRHLASGRKVRGPEAILLFRMSTRD